MRSLFWRIAFLHERLKLADTSDIRDVFTRSTCISTDEQQFQFRDRKWILEVNPWTSHEIVSTIAGIILRDYIGYSVDFNVVASPARVYERCAHEVAPNIDGEILSEAIRDDEKAPYANMEVWVEYFHDEHAKFVLGDKKVIDMGHMDYGGLHGVFISRAFAFSWPLPVEHFRAFDLNFTYGTQVVEAMRRHDNVSCAEPGICCCKHGSDCNMLPDGSLSWCPASDAGTLPRILAGQLNFLAPLIEQLAESIDFALHWQAERDTSFRSSFQSLAYYSGELVFAQRPSYLLSLLRTLEGIEVNNLKMQRDPVRISFPLDNCRKLGEPSDFSHERRAAVCDFSESLLVKLASKRILRDPVAKTFFESFSLKGESGLGDVLIDGGIENILLVLANEIKVNRLPMPSEIFDVACRWVKDNEGRGADWTRWVLRRQQPFFAALLSNPWLSLIAMTIVSIVFVFLWEHFYLRTTLSPFRMQEIWKKNVELREARSSAKNPVWRSPVEERLQNMTRSLLGVELARKRSHIHDVVVDSLGHSFEEDEVTRKPNDRWKGLSVRISESAIAQDFWKCIGTAYDRVVELKEPPERNSPGVEQVQFAMHTFPAFPKQAGEAIIVLCRTGCGIKSTSPVSVKVRVDECGGGAKSGVDFLAGDKVVTFQNGNHLAVLRLPITYHEGKWRTTVWFRVRLISAEEGNVVLAAPDHALVLLLDEHTWPADIPKEKRGGRGISLLRYLWKSDYERRGEKWRKTMYAMLWLPVHSVFVSTIVQKLLVDHVVAEIKNRSKDNANADFFYWEGLILVVIQLVSLGLNRWADVVQTQNRGRTGGVRQFHRAELARKFLLLEHAEHWLASEANWLYAAIYDADVLTGKAYFQVFVLFQALFALFLSVLIVIGLTLWSYTRDSEGSGISNLWYLVVAFISAVLSFVGVFLRNKLTWITVITRKEYEAQWFKGMTWIMSNWRQFHVLDWSERIDIEKKLSVDNGRFVPAHWVSRDTSNDTSWVAKWLQGCSYCFILLFGLYALIEYSVHGIGGMEVGTYYALLKVFNTLGKYCGKVSGVISEFQRAIVSLRDVAAIFNQMDQISQREIGAVLHWYFDATKLGTGDRALDLQNFDAARWRALGFQFLLKDDKYLIFEHGCSFLRPSDDQHGMIFGEFIFQKELKIQVGRLVCLYGSNETVLQSVLGVIAGVLTANGGSSDWVNDSRIPIYLSPRDLRCKMIPMSTSSASSYQTGGLIHMLTSSGVHEELCRKLAECVGLNPDHDISRLSASSLQVFAVVKAILYDPDVLCAYHPFPTLSPQLQRRLSELLTCWQMCGGLPHLATLLGSPMPETDIHRSRSRTLILGNCWHLFEVVQSRVTVDLDEFVGGSDSIRAEAGYHTIAQDDCPSSARNLENSNADVAKADGLPLKEFGSTCINLCERIPGFRSVISTRI